MCQAHYNRKWRGEENWDRPVVPGNRRSQKDLKCPYCGRQAYTKGLCAAHYDRARKGLDLEKPLKIGNTGWLDKKGYRWLHRPDHPNSKVDGAIAEHRYIMSQFLGRALLKEENIHHKNGNKSDNCIENLELWSSMQPTGQRIEDKIIYAKTILKLYDPTSLRE